MNTTKTLKIHEVDYHRNGVSGEGFHVVSFYSPEEKTEMVGILFGESGQCAVFDRDKLGQGIIAFFQNSWRGHHFESELRQAIEDRDKQRDAELCAQLEDRMRQSIVKEWI